ncbi:MAG TPA: hypothetical protein VFY65_12195 [Longimicrobium sp.]|nr:hypothetical protein [Longimicrobium sp.]
MTEQAPAPVEERPAHARHGVAGWLVLAWLLATAGRFAWTAWSRFGEPAVPWWSKIATAAVALLALAAAMPLLRFRRSGWEMAVWVLVTAVVMDLALIVLGTRQWIAVSAAAGASAFCLGYLWRARSAFAAHDDHWDEAVDGGPHPPAVVAPPDASRQAAAQPAVDPVEDALGAIHRRIVDAGSACAVEREALLAEAARYGVRADALRREGIPLYRTFLDHFLADGPLTAEEDRELFCLESQLQLDAIAVARLRAEREAADRAPAARPAADGAEDPVALVADDPFRAEPVDPDSTQSAVFMTYTPGLAGLADPAALADYEQHELDALTRWAGIELPRDAEPRPVLEALRTFHRIRTEPLEEVDPGMPLADGERCFAVRRVDLFRMTPGAQPDADAAAHGGVDGAAFVDGSLERDCDLSRYGRAGECRFLVTDRRLLLVAPSGQQSPLPLDRIRAVQPHRNGLEVYPTRGNPVFLAFRDGVADAAMRISRALADARGA